MIGGDRPPVVDTWWQTETGALMISPLPGVTAGAGAYALVGMGTAFAGIIRAPLTSVIMIFEVTRDYTIIVPLMISNLIAFYISQRLQHEPIYEALARQDGLHLPTGAFRDAGRHLRVSSAIREAPEPLPADHPLWCPDDHDPPLRSSATRSATARPRWGWASRPSATPR